MVQKLVIALIAFGANFLIAWYGNFTSRLPEKGTYLGFAYDSAFVRALVTQFEYLWVLIIINVLFTWMFHLGFENFKDNFLALTLTWLAMGPIAAVVFSSLILKQPFTLVGGLGVALVIVGAVLVTAQKEIIALLK